MKPRYLFLLLAMLLVTVALFASCDQVDTTTTAPDSTSVTTTAEDAVTTTEAVTTTAPVTTGTPAVSKNPIKKVDELSNGTLRITYMDNTKNALGAIAVREGYNSADVTAYSLDEATGILTLTLRDNAALNTANIFLEKTPADVTVRLREMGGNLEWASASAEDWQVLCTKGAAKVLEQLASAAGVGKASAVTTGTGTILAVDGANLRFRATEWCRNGYDLVNDAVYTRTDNNRFFNLTTIREISSSLAADSVSTSGAVNWKGASDDITPVNVNGTYIGANHGYFVISAIPNTAGLTEEDIGSVWKTPAGQKYVLVRIAVPKEVGSTMLWFCPFDDTMMSTGVFSYKKITSGTQLTATEDYDTSVPKFTAGADSTQVQFYVAVNNIVQHAFVDGKVEVDLSKKGSYEGEFIDFYESYDILYLPAVLEHLMDNFGKNTDESHHSEKITEIYMSFYNTYRFHKNGSTVVYTSYKIVKNLPTVAIIAGVQSGAFSVDTTAGEGHYVYVPGTTDYATPTLQPEGVQFYVGTGNGTVAGNLANPDQLITSYFQMTKPDGSKAMNLGYNPEFGYGIAENRLQYLGMNNNSGSNLAFYYTSHKMYPKLLSYTALSAGTEINFISYRIPTNKTDEDFTAINWYWVDDVIYLSLHTDKAVDERTVSLPEYMNGMTATVIEGSDTFTVVSDAIANNSITVSSTDAGYAIIKLTKN